MTHTIALTINRFGEPAAEYHCYEPPGAWCLRPATHPDVMPGVTSLDQSS